MKRSSLLLSLLLGQPAIAAEFSTADICKAAISLEMGRPVKTMVLETPGDVPVISYIRKDDKQKFIYRCKVQGSRVVWATYFADDNSWGRWRDSDDYEDAKIFFSLNGSELKVKHEHAGPHTYKPADFKI